MATRVIQGFFPGGQPPVGLKHQPPIQAAARSPMPPPPGGPRVAPPRPWAPVQAKGAAADSFAVDPHRIGLNRGGGKPLPPTILAKMEAAFGTDFSAVRIHEGPQAARIGALAFTTGTDIYFSPGRYQPETLQGQQLLGHELAHVVQQRQGRVKAPAGAALAVVQDRALEAEADRMGMRAAQACSCRSTTAPTGTPPTKKSCGCSGGSIQASSPGKGVIATLQLTKVKNSSSRSSAPKKSSSKKGGSGDEKEGGDGKKGGGDKGGGDKGGGTGHHERGATSINCYNDSSCSNFIGRLASSHNCCTKRSGSSWKYVRGDGTCYPCRSVKTNEGSGTISRLKGGGDTGSTPSGTATACK